MVYRIIIDTGKANTKGILQLGTEIIECIMPTRIEKANNRSAMGYETITYNDENYFVGYGEHNLTILDNQTKMLDEHRLCVYTMICKLFEKCGMTAQGDKIELTINVPIIEYLNNYKRAEYLLFFGNDKDVIIEHNDNIHHFVIDAVYGEYEASGVVCRHAERFVNKKTLVFQCGGKNLTYCLFIDMVPQREFCGSLVYGGNRIVAQARAKIQEVTGYDFNDTIIERIITGLDNDTLNDEEKAHIDIIVKEQLEQILKIIKSKGIDLNHTDVVFSGGTSLLYLPYLSELLDPNRYYISHDPLFDSVKGWLVKAQQRG